MTDIIIYSDFNCPFCFVYSERLHINKLSEQFVWCFVEHAPDIVTHANTPEQLSLLQAEWELASQRAPDTKINKPGFCVNSHLAIMAMISFTLKHPALAHLYRRAIYQAYWVHGEDISQPSVLEALQANLPAQVPLLQAGAEQVLASNQKQWYQHNEERRIPSLLAHDGEGLLGLQDVDSVKSFIGGHKMSYHNSLLSCDFQPVRKIAVVGLGHVYSNFVEMIDSGGYLHCEDMDDFFVRCDNESLQAVLFAEACKGEQAWANLRQIRDAKFLDRHLPAIAVVTEYCADAASQAYLMGATDIVLEAELNEKIIPRIKSRVSQYSVMQMLAKDASIDGLTGLYNRRQFNRLLEKEWRRSCRNKMPLSLVMIDVDYFKNYNDHYGHCRGDVCLQDIAAVIADQLGRGEDVAARFGGEEFVLILPSTGEQGMVKVMQKLLQAINSRNIEHKGSAITDHITVSLGGVFTHPHANNSSQQLLKLADRALYQAKRAGRNQFCIDRYL